MRENVVTNYEGFEMTVQGEDDDKPKAEPKPKPATKQRTPANKARTASKNK